MQQHFHMALWIDHHEARIFSFNADQSDKLVVHPEHPVRNIHHKANSIGSGHAIEDQDFYDKVTQHIRHAGAILVAGPANARIEFIKYLRSNDPALAQKINAVERTDRFTDAEFLAHAREYFSRHDRMTPLL
jgi:stalled ribosome rescue protein Dom34